MKAILLILALFTGLTIHAQTADDYMQVMAKVIAWYNANQPDSVNTLILHPEYHWDEGALSLMRNRYGMITGHNFLLINPAAIDGYGHTAAFFKVTTNKAYRGDSTYICYIAIDARSKISSMSLYMQGRYADSLLQVFKK